MEAIYPVKEFLKTSGKNPAGFDEYWRSLVSSDFSPTEYLENITGKTVEVELIESGKPIEGNDGAPSQINNIRKPVIRRETWLYAKDIARLAYAVSWWNENDMISFMRNPDQTIWSNLSNVNGLRREITHIVYGNSSYFQSEFRSPGPFYGRFYMFYINNVPLAYIQEVFSTKIKEYTSDYRKKSQNASN